MVDKTVTVWMDVETKKGTKEITRAVIYYDETPMIWTGRDRHHICSMDFPEDQEDMKKPFVDALAWALAVLLITGLKGNQASGQIAVARDSARRVLHEGLNGMIPQAFAAIALEGFSVDQYRLLRDFIFGLKINEEFVRRY